MGDIGNFQPPKNLWKFPTMLHILEMPGIPLLNLHFRAQIHNMVHICIAMVD